MMPEYQPYSPQEDSIILSVWDNAYTDIRNKAECARQRISKELGVERSRDAVKSRLQRIRAYQRTFGRVIYR